VEPIEKNLRSEKQIAIARLQDLTMESMLAVENGIILYGGTTIWRCFGGKRFSFDLDIYATDKQHRKLIGDLTWELNKRGIIMDYQISTERVIDLHNDLASVKLEILKKPKGKKAYRGNT
jgi:predicted nucleotidyltransferase component of viral defense system